jgi:hypothetical protein
MKSSKVILAAGLLAIAAGCSSVRESNGAFVSNAQCFRIVGFAIPEDDQQAAMNLVPAGAKITNVSGFPADWKSFWGFFGNLFWFHWTTIGGTK